MLLLIWKVPFSLEVEKGDFFGTGKINADMQNGIIIYHKWNVN
jgi:hypothetical protein